MKRLRQLADAETLLAAYLLVGCVCSVFAEFHPEDETE